MFLDHLWCLVWLTLLNLALNLVWDWTYPFQTWDSLTWLIRLIFPQFRMMISPGLAHMSYVHKWKKGISKKKSSRPLEHIPLAPKDLSWKDSFHLRCCGDLGYAPEVCPNNFSEYTKIPKSTRQNYVGFPDKTCNSWTVEIIHPVISLRSGSELYKYYQFPIRMTGLFKSVAIIWPQNCKVLYIYIEYLVNGDSSDIQLGLHLYRVLSWSVISPSNIFNCIYIYIYYKSNYTPIFLFF